jgi:hypothetical protein
MKLREAGPTTFEIRDKGRTVGHVWKHAEEWRAKIGAHEAMAGTPEDAATAASAKVRGQSIDDIPKYNPGFLEMKESKKYIYRLLGWLADNAARHDGELRYSHADVEGALKTAPRVIGNLTSLMDLACVMADLPPIGCTPEEGPFTHAWQKSNHAWNWPAQRMIERARAHRWSAADFEKLRVEVQKFTVWKARKAWDDALTKDDAKIREWAYR